MINFFILSLTVALNLLLGAVQPCSGTVARIITANHDGLACPGEELVYICVSQGDNQRWHIINEDGSFGRRHYSRTDAVGAQRQYTDGNQNHYTIVLNSTAFDNFISTISVVATMSIHNTRLECHSRLPTVSVVIQIAGIPFSPLSVQSVVDEYHDYSSTALFTWNGPHDNSRVDYYQYQVVNETKVIAASNTSNTSVIISGVPYNKNITFSVLAGNCIGESATVLETINIVGCSKLEDSTFNINVSTFSQAPGTKISYLCTTSNREENPIVYSTCQDNGRWEPDPSSELCSEDPTDATVTVTDSEFAPSVMETPETAELPITYILIALVAVGVCILAGVIICCIVKKLILRWKKGSLRESNSNHEYNEVIDPIYEAVSTVTVTGSTHSAAQIKVENNDAYRSIKLNERSSRIPVEIDIENNINVLQMENNKSYQVAPFNLNNDPVIPEGLTTTYTQECYETQSECDNENIQQATSGRAKVPCTSQNYTQVEFYSQGWSIPLYIESVDMNNYNSAELTFEPQLQGVCISKLSCEKQSKNSKDIESHTDKKVQ